ncbi:MAG: hypothetical protein EHM80_02585 [Nitrospiraceae bacterium]|nr:MAG: hypothetical protein EHM80_02585 [Nitrospiraceae bacterium]
MTMWRRWVQRGVLCSLMLGGLTACSMLEHPHVDQISSDDHSKLASWYEKEAALLRQSAKDELALAEAYRKKSGNGAKSDSTKSARKVDLVQHYEALAGLYMKAAEEADHLANEHRSILKYGHIYEGTFP